MASSVHVKDHFKSVWKLKNKMIESKTNRPAVLFYLHCLWLLSRQSGSCLSGSQRTSWTRPWLLSLSLLCPHIRLNWQRRERLFNTLFEPDTSEPARSRRINPNKTHLKRPRSDWHPSYGSVVPRARARSADFTHPLIKPCRQEWAKKKEKKKTDTCEGNAHQQAERSRIGYRRFKIINQTTTITTFFTFYLQRNVCLA